MSLMRPFNLKSWIEQHRLQLQPPVCNKQVFVEDSFIVMVVGGPNSRADFHIEEGPELFYQLEGNMLLKTMQHGKNLDIPIKQGDIFLLPPKIPHSPQREANSIGIVVERARLPHEQDGLQWYCQQCNHLLYQEFFTLRNIEKDLMPVIRRFYAKEQHRHCEQCGDILPASSC